MNCIICGNRLRKSNTIGKCRMHRYNNTNKKVEEDYKKRKCAVEECKEIIRNDNKHGFCRKHRLLNNQYRIKQRECNRKWKIANKEKRLEYKYWIKKAYGIKFDNKIELCKNQEYKCLICKKIFKECELFIDHNHKTNIVSGLLCRRCNSAIGLFDDNIEIILSAAKYVESK